LQKIVGVPDGLPIRILDGPTYVGNDDSFERPQSLSQRRSHPFFKIGSISHQALIDSRLQAPGMAVPSNGQRRIAELKEAEVHEKLAI
jgi:hypothetical protein